MRGALLTLFFFATVVGVESGYTALFIAAFCGVLVTAINIIKDEV
jgi:hypothetical protein